MANFTYRAFDKYKKEVSGTLQASSVVVARKILRDKELMIISLSKKKSISFKSKVSSLELSMLTRQFAILLQSGLSVEQALKALIEQLNNVVLKEILDGVYNTVISGRSLSYAMGLYPKVFSKVYCSLIYAGEQTGTLANVMLKLSDYADKTRALTSKVLIALLYPMIISIVAIIMIIALLTYVVPQVVHVFETSGQTLPILTRILIAVSNFTVSYGLWVLSILIIFIFYIRYLLKKEKFRIRFYAFLLKLPIAGKLLLNIDVARFANTLSLLLESGVPIISALQSSHDTVKNVKMKYVIQSALKLVQEGVSLADSLHRSDDGIFPPVLVYLVASGEKSGKLPELLLQVAAYQELELTRLSDVLTGVLEPILILFMGLVILLIVIAILLPILDLNNIVSS